LKLQPAFPSPGANPPDEGSVYRRPDVVTGLTTVIEGDRAVIAGNAGVLEAGFAGDKADLAGEGLEVVAQCRDLAGARRARLTRWRLVRIIEAITPYPSQSGEGKRPER